MKFSSEIKNGVIKLTFSGDLIGENNGPDLIELVNDALSNDVRNCLIDITDVRYMNSSGIGVLITILTKFRNQAGDLYLINPSEHVRKLLIITKLQAIFNIVESEEAALKNISK